MKFSVVHVVCIPFSEGDGVISSESNTQSGDEALTDGNRACDKMRCQCHNVCLAVGGRMGQDFDSGAMLELLRGEDCG